MTIRVLHAAWALVVAAALALSIIAIPSAYVQLRVPCVVVAACTNSRATPQIAASIVGAGYSLDIYAAYIIGLCLLVLATCLIVGGLLYRVRAQSLLTLTGAYGLALFPFASTPLAGFLRDDGLLGPIVAALQVIGVTASIWFFFTFPDGRFVPGWTRWVLLFYLATTIPRRLGLFPGLFLGIEGAAFGLTFLALLGSWAYRYRSGRDPKQRRQMRWAIFGFSASFAGFLLALGFAGLSVSGVLEVAPLALLASAGIVYLSLASVPVWLAIAILRHRLYDIDLLIKRTVVYGATSAAIATAFFVGLVALQQLLRPITNGSDLAVAAATLLSFALFQPVRLRVQDAIDRRFDRSRYDAARTLESFAVRLRDEVDLGAVRAELLRSVERTMGTAHVSLWIRERPG